MEVESCAAVIVAAGSGSRMNNKVKKQFLQLHGKPVLAHTLEAFEYNQKVGEIILVVMEGDEDFCREEIVERYRLHKVIKIVKGGRDRQGSVYNGLKALKDNPGEIVLIHDGVRPLISSSIISKTAVNAAMYGAASAAVPIKDTIVMAENGFAAKTIDRDKLWKMQTPQGFKKDLLMRAHHLAIADGIRATDDAALLERMGHQVKLVQGQECNIKITTPADLVIADSLLKEQRQEDHPCA